VIDRIHTLSYRHTYTHPHTHTLSLSRTHTLSRTRTHTVSLAHTHIHTQSLSHTHTHTHTVSLAHTHIHTQSLSHTHTYTLTHAHAMDKATNVLHARPHLYCYLLQSDVPRSLRTYIGFTVDPSRRLRQHNGEIGSGARKTQKGRPWRMLCFVGGFPNKIVGLQFEWQWQNPQLSRIARLETAHTHGLRNAHKQLHTLCALLQCKLWKQLDLQIWCTDRSTYATLTAQSCALRIQSHIHLLPLEQVEQARKSRERRAGAVAVQQHPTCAVCHSKDAQRRLWRCTLCETLTVVHVVCLARTAAEVREGTGLVPDVVCCPRCRSVHPWHSVVCVAHTLRHQEVQNDEDGSSGSESMEVDGSDVEACIDCTQAD
jgi:predicted GIY-YIG superfamily endonuclease